MSVHCLRKSYGTNLADIGTPVHTLKDMMGHSDVKTTMSFYIKSTDANKLKAVEALEQMMGAGQRSIPVRVQFQFIGDWQGMLKGKKYKQYPDHRKGSKGRTIIERESYSTKISLVTSPSFELKGTYTRGKKGNDQLQASYQESRTLPSTEDKPGFASRYREFHKLPPLDLKCPGRKVTSNCTFSLTRKRVK